MLDFWSFNESGVKTHYLKNFYLISFLILFYGTSASAQKVDEVLLDGLLVVPAGTASEGVHVFNLANSRGAVVTSDGRFEILASQRDTLVFTGIQFKELKVEVTRAMVASRSILLDIQEGVNELPEVVIKEHDLSGILSEDSKNIVTETFEIPSVPAPVGPPTGVESPQNTAMNHLQGGANILSLLQAGLGLLFPKRIKQPPLQRHNLRDQIELRQRLRSLLDEEFFTETLELKKEEIGAFLEFSVDRDFDADLLEEKQRMYLLQFLFDQREAFSP